MGYFVDGDHVESTARGPVTNIAPQTRKSSLTEVPRGRSKRGPRALAHQPGPATSLWRRASTCQPWRVTRASIPLARSMTGRSIISPSNRTDLGDLVRVLGFWQDDPGEPRPGDRLEIIPKPRGRRTVHAHVRGALRREPGRDSLAGLGFLLARDRVFEVEDHGVCPGAPGLLEAVGAIAKDEEVGAS